MKRSIQSPPRPVISFLEALGAAIASARKGRPWRQEDLGERLGAARQTIARLEKGDPSVSIVTYLTACWLLDIPLFPGVEFKKSGSENALTSLLNFMKKEQLQRVRLKKKKVVDDNF